MLTPFVCPLAPMLRKLEQHDAFSEGDREALLSLPHSVKSLEAGSFIVREGDRPSQCCLLISGFAYRQKIVADGARQILSVHMSGDLVDLQNSLLGTADHGVQTLTRCDLAFIPRDDMRRIAFDRPAVGEALWYDTLVDGAIFREWIANIGRRSARVRVAHILCEFAIRLEAAGLGSHVAYELPMTQEQLADCAGLTPVHVNRTLKGLERERLISKSRRAISIPDWKLLAEQADFRSAYLHLRPDQLLAA